MSLVFPPQSRAYFIAALTGLLIFGLMVTAGVTYYATPKYSRVGYAPVQPIAYSHELHVGQLGMDCTYCHTHVGESPHTNVPSIHTCWNCHGSDRGNIKSNSRALAPLREAWQTGQPLDWVRVHKVPEYAYFNHAVHVARGVSCVSCHGQVNEMKVVIHAEPLSMAWCLDCHRDPYPHLRPADRVTDLDWSSETDPLEARAKWEMVLENLKQNEVIKPPEDCSGCHR